MPLPWCCVNCLEMDYCVEEGIPRELIEFDFAEDAIDFECQLAEAREVIFTQPLTEPLAIGSHIVCTGTPDENLPWFTINICCGTPEEGDMPNVAVHFNVRMPQCFVVRNVRRHRKWGNEETTSFRPFPFKVGRPFTIEVLVDETETLWAVDGEFYCSYKHRNPSPLAANYIEVIGVRDATLNIQKTEAYPLLAPPMIEVPSRSSIDAERAENESEWHPNVTACLPTGVPEAYQLVICGRLRPLLHSFSLELLDIGRDWPRPNVMLYVELRAREDAQKDRQLVVLNSRLGDWGQELRQRTARLVPGTHLTFRVVRGSDEWSVYADNLLLGELQYRGSPNGVRAMRLRGDLFPEQIYVCPVSNTPQIAKRLSVKKKKSG